MTSRSKATIRAFSFLLCLGGLAMRYLFTAPGFYGFRTETYSSSWLWKDNLGNLEQFFTYLRPWVAPTLLASLPLILASALLLTREEEPRSWPDKLDRYFPSLAASGFLLLVLLRTLYFAGPLLSQDEKAYYFEADVIRMGLLKAPPPPFLDSFQQAQVLAGTFWTSSYQVGWPATVAAGECLGLARYLNCGWWLIILLTLRALGARLKNREAGLAAAGLFAVSPQFWMQALGDYPHLQTTALALLSWWSFLHLRATRQRRSWPWALFCCLLWAGVASTRVPETLTAMIVPLGFIVADFSKTRDRTVAMGGIALLAVGSVVSLSACAVLNWGQTGSPTTFSYQLYYGDVVKQYRIWGGFYNLGFYVFRSAWWMPPVFFPLLFRRPEASYRPLWLAIAAQIFIYLHFFTNGCGEWGARYYTLPLTVGCLLAGGALSQRQLGRTMIAAVALVCLVSGLHTFALCLPHYQGMLAQTRAMDLELGPAPAVVFVRKSPRDDEVVTRIANRPNFQGRVTAIWLDPKQNQTIRNMFKDRAAWLLDLAEGGRYHLQPYPESDAELFSSANYYAAGANYLSLHDSAGALRCFKQSLPGPDEGRTLALVGLLERDQGDVPAALASLQKAVTVAPQNWAARNFYAQVLQGAGQTAQARAQYEEVVRGANPASPEARAAASALGR